MPERIETELTNKKETLIEKSETVDIAPRKETTVPREVKSWMEEMEKRPSVNVYDDKTGQTIMQTSDQTNDDYQLPTGRLKFISGFKESLESAARWFSVFVLRIIKKKQGKVKFKQEDE